MLCELFLAFSDIICCLFLPDSLSIIGYALVTYKNILSVWILLHHLTSELPEEKTQIEDLNLFMGLFCLISLVQRLIYLFSSMVKPIYILIESS